jgi:hypothetical protein
MLQGIAIPFFAAAYRAWLTLCTIFVGLDNQKYFVLMIFYKCILEKKKKNKG